MRILLVEDQPKTAHYIQKGLQEHGFMVDLAFTCTEGLEKALSHRYQVLILDIMLPDGTGWDIAKAVRAKKKDTPILFLSARDDVEDKVRGLELGGDDYLTKPFAFSELLARIKVLGRRANKDLLETIDIADLSIDLTQHKITRAGQSIRLTAKEFALLVLLAKKKNRVLSRTLIMEHVWDIHFENDVNIVDVTIRRLRQKIDEGFAHKLIQTIRGQGYTLSDENMV